MTSFSGCFFLVSMVVSLPLLLGSSSTKYIDTLCNNDSVSNKTFCLQTLTAYPPAVSATNMVNLAKKTFGLGASHAKQILPFIAELAKEPTFTRYFEACNGAYTAIVSELRGAIRDIDGDPMDANYDVIVCFDQIRVVKVVIGKNTDKASKKLMEMTFLMEKFIEICDAATYSVPHNY